MRLLGEVGLPDPDEEPEWSEYCRRAETEAFEAWQSRNQFAALLHTAPATHAKRPKRRLRMPLQFPTMPPPSENARKNDALCQTTRREWERKTALLRLMGCGLLVIMAIVLVRAWHGG